MPKELIKVESLQTRAKFEKSSLNKEKRTVDIVLATETLDVRRYDWRNDVYYIEQLVITPETVRMDRINNGAPLLDNHNVYGSVRNGLGKVVNGSAKIGSDGKLRCTIQFSRRPEVEGVLTDVEDGILENTSVGYTVYKYERQPVVDGETPIYRVIDWEPYEATLCLVPADPEAGINRSYSKGLESNAQEFEVEFIDAVGYKARSIQAPNNPKIKNQMKDLEKRALAVGLPATASEAEVVAAERKLEVTRHAIAIGLEPNATEAEVETAERAFNSKKEARLADEAAKKERSRTAEINKLCRTFNLSAEFSDKLIEDGTGLDQARALIMDEYAKSDKGLRGSVSITGKEESEKRSTGIMAGLILRGAALSEKELTDEEKTLGNNYRNISLLDLAKESLEKSNPGSTRGLGKMEIAQRAITSNSSDFPVLLEGTNRRVLLAAYKNTPDKWRQFCAIGSVSDFRDWSRVRPGSITRLDALNENGEYKIKELVDGESQKVNVSTYGNIINISRKMIVNDDLGAFLTITKALGRAAARGIEIDVFKLLSSNSGLGPTMKDGNTLFHASHENLGASGIISMASFSDIKTIMASQKDRQSNDYLDINAAIWLGPIGSEGLAKSVNGSQYDPDASNKLQKPNIVQGMFNNLVGTPRLSGTRWYAFADPNDFPVIEVSFLEGNQTPFMDSQQEFSQDGVSWKVRQDYGVSVVDWVGAATAAGA